MKIALTSLALLASASLASANTIDFAATIDGDQNGNASPATGTMNGTFDPMTGSFEFDWTITDELIGAPAQPGAHIHVGDVGVSGPIVFGFETDAWPLSGSATWEGMTAQNISDLMNGLLYINFHTTEFPGGEVRGQILKIPAPGATALFGLGGLAMARRRR